MLGLLETVILAKGKERKAGSLSQSLVKLLTI